VNAPRHLTPEVLFGYEHQLLTPEEVVSVHEHLEICEACRAELAARMGADGMEADIRAQVAATQSAPGAHYIRFAAAAAIFLLAGVGLWLARRPGGAEMARQPDAAAEALQSGTLPLPAFVAELNPPREMLMGDSKGESAALISPKGTAVMSPRPAFEWQPLAGMRAYRVRVFGPDSELVVESPDVVEPRWTADRDLAAGVTYQWQVAAVGKGDERVTLPKAPDTPPRFRVVEPAVAERLRQLAAQSNTPHLVLAVEYGRAGLLDEARREMAAAVAADPANEALRKLEASLAAATPRR
jgi:hypothetical protein